MAKTNSRKLLLLPGDGIGPEVVKEAKKIIEWLNKNKSLLIKHLDKCGTPFKEESNNKAYLDFLK